MGTAKKRRWGMLACMLLSVMLVMALVPQAAWAEVAAESTDAAQTGVTTTDTDGMNDQTDDTEDGSKSDYQGDMSGDQDDQADKQGTQGSQNADSSVQQSKAGNAVVLSAMDDDSDTTGGTDASSHVHCTITSNATTFSSGDTGDFKVSYKIDPGSIKEGDTLTVRLPKTIARTAKLYVSSQHFKAKQDNGDGTWTLTFGPDASTALTGTFEMFVTMATVASETNGDISVGNDSLAVKVLPTAPQDGQQGSGKPDYVIRKDIIRSNDEYQGNEPAFIGYDYVADGSDHAFMYFNRDLSEETSTQFRLLVNEKEITMSGVTVKDTLPDGMTFDTSEGHDIKVVRVKNRQSSDVDASLYSATISGNTLTFTYKGELSDTIEIYYWARTPAGSNGANFVNRADISYASNGTAYSDHRQCMLQGTSYSAANGTKMVDKTELSSDDDQQVTYTFKFWNNNGFGAGEISLKDYLNSYVDYKTALDNDKFSVTWDEKNHCVDITNKVAISGNDVEYVSFVTDFSRVPDGMTVENRVAYANSYDTATGTYTIYGNPVKTIKYRAWSSLTPSQPADDAGKGDDTGDNTGDNTGNDTGDTGDNTDNTGNNTDDNTGDNTDNTGDTGDTGDNTDNNTADTTTDTTKTTEEQTSPATTETKTAADNQQPAQAPKQESVHQDAAPKGSLPQTGDVSSPVLPVLFAGLLVLAVACALRVRHQDRV